MHSADFGSSCNISTSFIAHKAPVSLQKEQSLKIKQEQKEN